MIVHVTGAVEAGDDVNSSDDNSDNDGFNKSGAEGARADSAWSPGASSSSSVGGFTIYDSDNADDQLDVRYDQIPLRYANQALIEAAYACTMREADSIVDREMDRLKQ